MVRNYYFLEVDVKSQNIYTSATYTTSRWMKQLVGFVKDVDKTQSTLTKYR